MKSTLNFDIKQINSFLTIISEGSFTGAARKLNIGQATISHHINQIEEAIKVSLFTRSGKTVKITREGKIFEKFSLNFFSEIDKLQINLDSPALTETVDIAASTIPADYILPSIISKLRKNNSNFQFRIDISDSREAIEKVKEKSVDIGIVGKEINHPTVKSNKLFYDNIVLIGSPEKVDTLTADSIKREDFIVRKKGSGTRKAWEKDLATLNIYPSSLNIVYECSTTEGIKKAVSAGIGIAFVSRLAVGNEIQSGNLKIIELENINIKRAFYLIYLNKAKKSIPVKAMIEALEKMYN